MWRGDNEEDHCIARIFFVHPPKAELFYHLQFLLERNVYFLLDGRTEEVTAYTTFSYVVVETGLNVDGHEYDKLFDEAVRKHVAPASAGAMLEFVYQNRAGYRERYEKHDFYMVYDIH